MATRNLLPLLLGLSGLLGCSEVTPEPPAAGTEDAAEGTETGVLLPAGQMLIPREVRDNVDRIDPEVDGWPGEILHDQAKPVVHEFLHVLLEREYPAARMERLLTADFGGSTPLRPSEFDEEREVSGLTVRRAANPGLDLQPAAALSDLAAELQRAFDPGAELFERSKIVSVESAGDGTFTGEVWAYLHGTGPSGSVQVNLRMDMGWRSDGERARLHSVRLTDYEEVRSPRPLFADRSGHLFGGFAEFEEEFLHSAGDYQHRVDQLIGNPFWGQQGLAIGDVNGDGLEDLFVCQQSGLPNRLLLHKPDGTVEDVTEPARVGYLENTASALILDLDSDGDQDLAMALGPLVAVTSNDGRGVFSAPNAFQGSSPAPIFSLTAADPDLDGDLDLYACRHSKRGLLYEIPTPYFDADNGSANSYFRNEGKLQFSDATDEVGLGENNTKFSYAALWEDFDRDGRPDLYVANDYGRNNLYRNEDGRFRDVAEAMGALDINAGMGATAGDFDLDGDLDLYVSNMFSSAGRRIVPDDERFLGPDEAEIKGHYLRHARGNSLLVNRGDGTFEDGTEAAGVAPGGWAWGARFVDFDNDGREDLYSPCGFVTGSDPDDL